MEASLQADTSGADNLLNHQRKSASGKKAEDDPAQSAGTSLISPPPTMRASKTNRSRQCKKAAKCTVHLRCRFGSRNQSCADEWQEQKRKEQWLY
ncbi:hypothetical protein AVEN_203482-1 [Araneus ventricosus]|uniref:Uncharacterized protein n=1 Tax=Araneus ventricosus TaxID=182803 RepID=A0A4Y2BGI2_ARAVE|nr:hypothetical protein AVEN_203482-1 [Araneus ventricosus]